MNLERLVGYIIHIPKDPRLARITAVVVIVCTLMYIVGVISESDEAIPPQTIEQFERAIEDTSASINAYRYYKSELGKELDYVERGIRRHHILTELQRVDRIIGEQEEDLQSYKYGYKLLKMAPASEVSVQ